jgi:hypothetical protein
MTVSGNKRSLMLSVSAMLHASNNMRLASNILVRQGVQELQGRLPPGWHLSDVQIEDSRGFAMAALHAPSGQAGRIAFETRARLAPKDVVGLVEYVHARAMQVQAVLIVVAPYLSESTKTRLRQRGVGYLDLTGNARIIVPEPGLFIETHGATEDPDPDLENRFARSLRGPKAGRVVRVLIDRKHPPGVRELATLTGLDAGYVSRVLAFLDKEALITRVGHGRIQSVDWPSLLRHWARDAPLESRGNIQSYLEPRGISSFVKRLAAVKQHVVTGSLAANVFAPVAPPRLATVWIPNVPEAATRLGLRRVETGANVLLIEPGDTSVFVGATNQEGFCCAAPSQVAADLLTSPGRGPAEGEELINWMQAHEEEWRR